MSSTTESTENELGTVMPKSPNFQLGFAVAVAMSFEPLRVAFTSNVTDFVTPCRVRSPVSMNAKSPEGASGSARPETFLGASSAIRKRFVSSVSRLMNPSRWDSSLEIVVISTLIFEPDEKVPSVLSVKRPCAPVMVRTASDGAGTRASCSRTRTVAFDAGSTLKVIPPACGAAVAVAPAVVVRAVAKGADAPLPPHPASRTSASAAARLGASTVTNTHDPLHLRMDATVIRVYAHLIECDDGALAAVEPDIEWASLVARGHGVELLPPVHERDRGACGRADLVRPVRPLRFPAHRLDDLDLV